MKITVYMSGRYKEVGFQDFEDDERVAYSGLLNEDEAADFAEQLQRIARKLTPAAATDDSQILLPFVADRAA